MPAPRVLIISLAALLAAALSLPMASTAAKKPPKPVPSVSGGSVAIGTTLTAKLKGGKIKVVLWQRCASAPVGQSCAAPATAGVGRTYTISAADANSYLRAVIAPKKTKRAPRPKKVMTKWFGPVPAPPSTAQATTPAPAPDTYAGPGDARTNPLAYNQDHTLIASNWEGATTESWRVKISDYTADATAIVAGIDEYSPPAAGYRWMRFLVTLTNTGIAMQEGGSYDVRLFPNSGVETATSFVDDPARLPISTNLLPGANISGWVYYQVPAADPATGVVAYANFSIYQRDGRFIALG